MIKCICGNCLIERELKITVIGNDFNIENIECPNCGSRLFYFERKELII